MTSLPEQARLGTSSWAYEGWQGLVYKASYPKSRFTKDSLAEYAAYEYRGAPLFRTVGLDHTFYRPATPSQLTHYAGQLPAGFRVCSKVWEEITIPVYARLPRYGPKGGAANPRFLDAALCEELVLKPSLEGLAGFAGPFIFEFQRSGLGPEEFLFKLDRFLLRLPAGPHYAVEVRSRSLLGARYHDVLNAHGASHVYNHWSAMPSLAAQHEALERRFTAPDVVIRLLTPLGISYAEAVKRASPYTKLVAPLTQMRQDTVELVRQAVAEGRSAYVLANNRAEGNAPMTIQALADLLTSTPPRPAR
jgi:uncharacterized protein YecE (DUF72 family)